MGVVRLGAEVNRDLAWGRGSSLSRMTGSLGVDSVLAEAYRVARATVAQSQLTELTEAANAAAQHARRFKCQQCAHTVSEQRVRPIEIRLDGIGERLREQEERLARCWDDVEKRARQGLASLVDQALSVLVKLVLGLGG